MNTLDTPCRVDQTPKFRTKKGRLTRYGLICGYSERIEADGVRLDLWMERPGNADIHIWAYNFNTHEILFWECITNLNAARGFFDNMKKKLLSGIPLTSHETPRL